MHPFLSVPLFVKNALKQGVFAYHCKRTIRLMVVDSKAALIFHVPSQGRTVVWTARVENCILELRRIAEGGDFDVTTSRGNIRRGSF